MSGRDLVSWRIARVFPTSLSDVCWERKVACFFLSVQLNICSTPVLTQLSSSVTSSLQSSATRTAAHASSSPLWFVIPPCAFKAKFVFAFDFQAKAVPALQPQPVTCPCGTRFRPSKPHVLCRFPSVCTASLGFSAAVFAQTSSSLLCISFHVMSSSLLWRSSVVGVSLDSLLSCSSAFFVMNFSLTTAYCLSWHLHMLVLGPWCLSTCWAHATRHTPALLPGFRHRTPRPHSCVLLSAVLVATV